jgi:hypothetical protein
MQEKEMEYSMDKEQNLQTTSATSEEAVYPIRVSENGRYFVDQKDRPFFWLGTTQWQLFRDHTPEEARLIIESVKRNGFNLIQVMVAGVGDGTPPNIAGEKPWLDDNALTPNPAYFQHVDMAIQSARENNVIISLTLYHQRWRKIITAENARSWAKWLAERYRDIPNIVWSMTPEAREEFVPVLRELAAGLQEGDGGRHLITFKPDPAPHSSSFLHTEDWLGFNCMQTWAGVDLIYPMVSHDYNLTPVKPVVMAEGAYETPAERPGEQPGPFATLSTADWLNNYGFEVTPLWVRRQAYYSYLLGSYHTYGHDHSWRLLPTWRVALDSPGAVQMGLLKQIFLGREEWWHLVPDSTILVEGGKTDGTILNLAARHKDGRWIMVYLAASTPFAVDIKKITGADRATAFWVDPRTGEQLPGGDFSTDHVERFITPEGWEDALLIVEPVEEKIRT